MATITIQDLQEIAVQATSDFFNNQVPLNQSLAKQASERGLNSEQLKRAIETTNTLTHLKSIEVSKDRTVEFPVADYTSIVKMASVPNLTGPEDEDVPDGDAHGFVEKAASAESILAYTPPDMTENEKMLHLQKAAHINKVALENAQINLRITGETLLKQAFELRKDPQFIEHLSASSADSFQFEKISTLVLGSIVDRKDYTNGMFKSAQLNEVESFVSLYKQASELTSEIKTRKNMDERWEMIKQASILGSLAQGVAKYTTKAVVAPAKLMGKAISAPLVAGAGVVGRRVNNAIASTGAGKAAGFTPKPTNPALAKKVMAVGTGVGMAAMDASAFEPKSDPMGYGQGRIWDNLQR